MKQIPVMDQMSTYIVNHWHMVVKATPGVMHAIAEFFRNTPSNAWALCAFVAAASIMVTVVTAYLWPRQDSTAAPARQRVDASGVRIMATDGVSTPEIARRTGLSHDAVATILRAGALSRGDRSAPRRKVRPRSA
jgi:protein-disulfide isomerase-like protein with CxxC motif